MRDAAQIYAVMANANRSKGKSFRVSDFLRQPPKGRRGQTTEAMKAAFDQIAGGH